MLEFSSWDGWEVEIEVSWGAGGSGMDLVLDGRFLAGARVSGSGDGCVGSSSSSSEASDSASSSSFLGRGFACFVVSSSSSV